MRAKFSGSTTGYEDLQISYIMFLGAFNRVQAGALFTIWEMVGYCDASS